jgi:hypothetical protein
VVDQLTMEVKQADVEDLHLEVAKITMGRET